ncbi:MAG TPA: DinB family protein [Gemmatimonadaceae bacterium]
MATEILERTPRTLNEMLGGLSADWTDPNEGPDTWSAYTNVGHLISGDRHNWIPRTKAILAQREARRFAPYDRNAQFYESEGKSLGDLLDEFVRIRRESLATLRGWRLTPAQLALEGEHPEFGVVTLKQHLSTWVAHDLGHIAQIARVMAKQYRDAVGPWRAYLPIMDR